MIAKMPMLHITLVAALRKSTVIFIEESCLENTLLCDIGPQVSHAVL